MKIELFFFDGCPNVQRARELLIGCLAELGLDAPVEEHIGDYPSPTIRVDGGDVLGRPSDQVSACRLDLPTRDKILVALQRALARRS